jgi:hypothetical protein
MEGHTVLDAPCEIRMLGLGEDGSGLTTKGAVDGEERGAPYGAGQPLEGHFDGEWVWNGHGIFGQKVNWISYSIEKWTFRLSRRNRLLGFR